MLDTWFPQPKLTAEPAESSMERLSDAEAADTLGPAVMDLLGEDSARGVTVAAVRVKIGTLATPPLDAHDVYLRLHLLSHRLVPPHGQNMDGVFGLLSNVVWTNHGPCPVEGFEE